MPTSRAVYACVSVRGESDGMSSSFYRVPKILYPNNRRWKNMLNITEIPSTRRQKWKTALRRDFTDEQYSNAYVCSLHFKIGKKRLMQSI